MSEGSEVPDVARGEGWRDAKSPAAPSPVPASVAVSAPRPGRRTPSLAALTELVLGAFAVGLVAVAIASFAVAIIPSWPPAIDFARIERGQLLLAGATLLLALAAMQIGSRLRRYQEIEAAARAELALNVDVQVRVLGAGAGRVLEVVVEVMNVSRAVWVVPMAYVFVNPALEVPHDFDARPLPFRDGSPNRADYGQTFCELKPDERDEFCAHVLLGPEQARALKALHVQVEVVGAPARWLAEQGGVLRAPFLEFMNEEGRGRHTYLCIRRHRGDGPWARKHCFVGPPPERRLDVSGTERFRRVLDDFMMWTRERVVSLDLSEVEAPPGAEAARPAAPALRP